MLELPQLRADISNVACCGTEKLINKSGKPDAAGQSPDISTPCHADFRPLAMSSADMKVCCLLLFVSYLSFRDILLKTLSANKEMSKFSQTMEYCKIHIMQATATLYGDWTSKS